MTKEELLAILKDVKDHYDIESAHSIADQALIDYINDDEIKKAYDELTKWYA